MAWKELPVAIPVAADGLALDGLWQPGSGRGAVIAPPHPEYGGSLDHPVVSEIAHALYRRGYASLRFNWRGVGASQGRLTGDPAAAAADYAAALDHVERTLDAPIIGAGYSFGAATVLRVALRDPRLRSLLLVAPPLSMIRKLPIADYGGPLRVIVGSEDAYARPAELSEVLAPLANARLEVIHRADHFFGSGGLGELQRVARASLG